MSRENNVHPLGVATATAGPIADPSDGPSVPFKIDPVSGGLIVVGVAGATANVTIINGAGAGAVNIQDGGNSITVDGIVSTVPSNTTTVPQQITKTVAATGVPEALAVNGTFFKSAAITAKKAPRTANTGNVYLGVLPGDDTQPIELQPGDSYGINAPDGQQYDLNDWYLDVATAGDGVVIIYS